MKIELDAIKIAMSVRWGATDYNWLDARVPKADFSLTFDSGLVYVKSKSGPHTVIIPLPNIAMMIPTSKIDG